MLEHSAPRAAAEGRSDSIHTMVAEAVAAVLCRCCAELQREFGTEGGREGTRLPPSDDIQLCIAQQETPPPTAKLLPELPEFV